MRDAEDIRKAQERGDHDTLGFDVEGMPPGYLVGFELYLRDEVVYVGPGVANVRGRVVHKKEVTGIDVDSASGAQFEPGIDYYLYLSSTGQFFIDRIAPSFDPMFYGRYHRMLGYRYIGQLRVNIEGVLEEVISDNPINVSSITADKISLGSLMESKDLNIVAQYLGYDGIEELAEQASFGRTLIDGGFINTVMINVEQLFSRDIVVSRQVRSTNYTEEGELIEPTAPGFWLGDNGKLRANDVSLRGRLTTGETPAQDAFLGISDGSGVIAGPTFVGTGVNDLEVVAEGNTQGIIEIEIQTTFPSVGDHVAGGVVVYDKGSVSNGWRYVVAAPRGALFSNINPGSSSEHIIWDTDSHRIDTHLLYGYSSWGHPRIMTDTVNTKNDFHCNGYFDWFINPNIYGLGDTFLWSIRNQLDAYEPIVYPSGVPGYWVRALPLDPPDAWYRDAVLLNMIDGTTRVSVVNSGGLYGFAAHRAQVRLLRVITSIEGYRWRINEGAWNGPFSVQTSIMPLHGIGMSIRFGGLLGHNEGDKWTIEQGAMRALAVTNTSNEELFSVHSNDVFYKGMRIYVEGGVLKVET